LGFGESFGRFERYVDEMYTTMHDESRERQLVDQARDGDHRAFEELCRGHRERLLALIRSRLGPAARQGADPEDVLQAALVRALHSLQRFEWRGDDSFLRWLESIAIHVTLDAVRHQGRRTVLRIDRDPTGDVASPSKGLRRRERLDRLELSMKALSPDYRTVLRLARMDGLSIKEIAKQMGRSESAVHNLLLRATKQLRQSFGDTESLNLGDEHFEDTETADGR
jgi:RNA polymerase sigma-70 factor (ECF subfamily)